MLVRTPSCVLWLMLGLVGWRFACTTDNNVFHVSSSQTTSLNKTIKIEWIVQIHSHFVNTTHSLARRGISLWTNENRTRMRQAAGQSHKRTGAQTGAIHSVSPNTKKKKVGVSPLDGVIIHTTHRDQERKTTLKVSTLSDKYFLVTHFTKSHVK